MPSDPCLLSPGPVNIPVRVLEAMNVPSMHHRSAEFSQILKRLLKNMGQIFNTEAPVLPVHATGRASLEATILNLLSPGDEIISSLGGIPFKMDEWGVDAAVTASQKALMGATGISFVALSPKAWEAEKLSRFPRGYFGFSDIRQKVEASNPETPGSSPVSLVAGMSEATQMIIDEGITNVEKRHQRLSEGIKAALSAMNLSLFPYVCARRSDTLTAVWMPKGVNPSDCISLIQNHFNIIVKAGLKQYVRSLRLSLVFCDSFYGVRY